MANTIIKTAAKPRDKKDVMELVKQHDVKFVGYGLPISMDSSRVLQSR